jgi:hypothetical protein
LFNQSRDEARDGRAISHSKGVKQSNQIPQVVECTCKELHDEEEIIAQFQEMNFNEYVPHTSYSYTIKHHS